MTCQHVLVTCRWGSPSFLLAEFWCCHSKNQEAVRLSRCSTNVTFSLWERRRSPFKHVNYVSTHMQHNTLQLTTIMKIAVEVQLLAWFNVYSFMTWSHDWAILWKAGFNQISDNLLFWGFFGMQFLFYLFPFFWKITMLITKAETLIYIYFPLLATGFQMMLIHI